MYICISLYLCISDYKTEPSHMFGKTLTGGRKRTSRFSAKKVRRTRTKHKNMRLKKGRKMVGGYGAAFIQYITSQIDELSKPKFRIVYEEDDGKCNIYNLIRTIVSGGAFTNKMDETGNGSFKPHLDLDKLLETTKCFYAWTKSFNSSRFNKLTPPEQEEMKRERVTLFRHVRTNATNATRNIVQPIPMSCTWSIDFAIGWMGSNDCCVYEITMPSTDVFLPLSLPPPHPATPSRIPLNQPQYEVTVAPCVLHYVGTRMHNGTAIQMYNGKTCENVDEVIRNFARVQTHGAFF